MLLVHWYKDGLRGCWGPNKSHFSSHAFSDSGAGLFLGLTAGSCSADGDCGGGDSGTRPFLGFKMLEVMGKKTLKTNQALHGEGDILSILPYEGIHPPSNQGRLSKVDSNEENRP